MVAAAMSDTPYCGAAPLPTDWWLRWNGDLALVAILAMFALWCAFGPRPVVASVRRNALAGCAVAAIAWLSPLCALGVALFSARVAQHLLLALVAAPLFASAWARVSDHPVSPLRAMLGFALAFWFWHLPGPYEATLRSDVTYWAAHASLFGTAAWLWRALLDRRAPLAGLLASLATSLHLGLLGALLTLAPAPLFASHLVTAPAWGLSALADQQLGGVLCWTLGCGAFLFAGLVAASRLLREGAGLRVCTNATRASTR